MKAGQYPARQYGLAAVLWLACVVRLADIWRALRRQGWMQGAVSDRAGFWDRRGAGVGVLFAEYPWLLDAWLCVGYLSYILLMDRNGREYTPSGMAGLYGVLLLIAFVWFAALRPFPVDEAARIVKQEATGSPYWPIGMSATMAAGWARIILRRRKTGKSVWSRWTCRAARSRWTGSGFDT